MVDVYHGVCLCAVALSDCALLVYWRIGVLVWRSRVEKKTGEKDKTRAGNDFQAVVKVGTFQLSLGWTWHLDNVLLDTCGTYSCVEACEDGWVKDGGNSPNCHAPSQDDNVCISSKMRYTLQARQLWAPPEAKPVALLVLELIYFWYQLFSAFSRASCKWYWLLCVTAVAPINRWHRTGVPGIS